jgi:hypothetical protein
VDAGAPDGLVLGPSALDADALSPERDDLGTKLFVAPAGSDDNPGTLEKPFRTVERARNAVRTLVASMSTDIVVVLRGGKHVLTAPLALDARDSGQNGYRVIYAAEAGEHPVLSGAQELAGWTLVDGNRRLWREIGRAHV